MLLFLTVLNLYLDRPFRDWAKAKLAKVFGLRKRPYFPPIQEWLKASEAIELSDLEHKMLAYIRQRAALHIDG